MRTTGLAAVTALVAGQMAMAQAWVDYDLLMEENADSVVTTTGADGQVTRTLDLGDGISVTCTETSCMGTDMNGAAGCAFAIVAELHAAAVACPGLIGAEEAGALARLYDLAGGHIAASAVPPQDWAQMGPVILGSVQARYDDGLCLSLIAEGPASDIRLMASQFAAPDSLDEMSAFFAQRRLPVMNPCL